MELDASFFNLEVLQKTPLSFRTAGFDRLEKYELVIYICRKNPHNHQKNYFLERTVHSFKFPIMKQESHWKGRYSDWLLAERPRGRSSIPGRIKNFHFSTSSRRVLRSIQPIQ
jgi:hypothetical protein